MERVEVVGSEVLILQTRQLGPECWCCGVYERHHSDPGVDFVFEDFGATEMEAIAMALHDAHEPNHLNHRRAH